MVQSRSARAKVTELDERRSHIVSSCVCVFCVHEWVAVIPEYAAENLNFECPKCGGIAQHVMGQIEQG